MTPHEVVKNSLEKFEERFKDSFSGGDMNEWERAKPIIEYLKSSHLSLLLSVKEMVETKKKDTSFWEKDLTPEEKLLKAIYSKEEYLAKEYCDGYNQALSDLQSLLDSEINKIKEIWEE